MASGNAIPSIADAASGSAGGSRDPNASVRATTTADQVSITHGDQLAAMVPTERLQEHQQQRDQEQRQEQPQGEQHDTAGSGTARSRREYAAKYEEQYPANYNEAGFADDANESGD